MDGQVKIKEAKKLLEQYAPEGEFLAYINKDEAEILKNLGGSGKPVEKTGIPSYYNWAPWAAAAVSALMGHKAYKSQKKTEEKWRRRETGRELQDRLRYNSLVARYLPDLDEEELAPYLKDVSFLSLKDGGGIMGLQAGGPISGPQSVGQSLTVNPGMSQSFVNTLTPHQQFSGYLNANQGIANLRQGGIANFQGGGWKGRRAQSIAEGPKFGDVRKEREAAAKEAANTFTEPIGPRGGGGADIMAADTFTGPDRSDSSGIMQGGYKWYDPRHFLKKLVQPYLDYADADAEEARRLKDLQDTYSGYGDTTPSIGTHLLHPDATRQQTLKNQIMDATLAEIGWKKEGGRVGLGLGGDPNDPAWGPPEITEGELLDYEETPPDLLEEVSLQETIDTPQGIETLDVREVEEEGSDKWLRLYEFFVDQGFSREEAARKASAVVASEESQMAMGPDPSGMNPMEQLMQQLEQQETPGQEPGMEELELQDILAKGGRPGYQDGSMAGFDIKEWIWESNRQRFSNDMFGKDYEDLSPEQQQTIDIELDMELGKKEISQPDRAMAQKGGRPGYNRGRVVNPGGYSGRYDPSGVEEALREFFKKDLTLTDFLNLPKEQQNDFWEDQLRLDRKTRAQGGRIGYARGSGIASIPKGHDFDLRDSGGFIPYGSKERADDVPARVSKNEFVMTADAVRSAGGGSVNKGAQRMYNLMNNLEARV